MVPNGWDEEWENSIGGSTRRARTLTYSMSTARMAWKWRREGKKSFFLSFCDIKKTKKNGRSTQKSPRAATINACFFSPLSCGGRFSLSTFPFCCLFSTDLSLPVDCWKEWENVKWGKIKTRDGDLWELPLLGSLSDSSLYIDLSDRLVDSCFDETRLMEQMERLITR